MNKINWNLLDDSFAHDKYMVAGVDSEHINWDRNCSNKENVLFLSNNRVLDILNHSFDTKVCGVLFESQAIMPQIYDNISPHINKFENFFTHSSELLNKNDNSKWIPGGGIWIGGNYGGGEIKIHPKNKLCSFVSSHKEMCPLHIFRRDLANSLFFHDNVDVYGLDKWVPIYKTLHDYKFSIVIENFRDTLYFTEKILNCFATGTIPIYYGATEIHKKFDPNGILTFNNSHELEIIINEISDDVYYEKISSIKNNFEISQRYKSLEDFIYNEYIK